MGQKTGQGLDFLEESGRILIQSEVLDEELYRSIMKNWRRREDMSRQWRFPVFESISGKGSGGTAGGGDTGAL